MPRAPYQKLAPLGRHSGESCLTSGVEPWTPPADPVDLPGAVLFTTSYSNSLQVAAVARSLLYNYTVPILYLELTLMPGELFQHDYENGTGLCYFTTYLIRRSVRTGTIRYELKTQASETCRRLTRKRVGIVVKAQRVITAWCRSTRVSSGREARTARQAHGDPSNDSKMVRLLGKLIYFQTVIGYLFIPHSIGPSMPWTIGGQSLSPSPPAMPTAEHSRPESPWPAASRSWPSQSLPICLGRCNTGVFFGWCQWLARRGDCDAFV